MSVLDWIVGIPVCAVILYYLVAGVWLTFTELIPFVYQALRYERKGICPVCHQRYVRRLVRLANDQTYGSGEIWQDVCPNGHVGMQHGNRRFADWAGF